MNEPPFPAQCPSTPRRVVFNRCACRLLLCGIRPRCLVASGLRPAGILQSRLDLILARLRRWNGIVVLEYRRVCSGFAGSRLTCRPGLRCCQ